MIETLQSLYASAKGRGRRIYLRAMTDHVVRDDRLGCPAQLARQYVAGSFAANQQAFCANETKKSALKGASRDMAKSMTEDELEELASTTRKGKPEHVSGK